MKMLTVTSLYPNAIAPSHGIFVENRLRHLLHHHPDIEAQVIAPVPWFPFSHPVFGRYSKFAQVPSKETRFGIEIYHPRYLVIPGAGWQWTPRFLGPAIYREALRRRKAGFDFDVIDGHYIYPDGVALSKIAKRLDKPFTLTARGTDINLIPAYPKPRKQISVAMGASHHNMAVCEALRQEMIKLGANSQSVTTLRNGVDLSLFSFVDNEKQRALRTQLGLDTGGPVLLSVGLLIARKGHHLVIEALATIRDASLVIVGHGQDLDALKHQIEKLGLKERVRFVGNLPQPELAEYYGAADALVLASSREGWANVLLEAMACGTPVVATSIWGTPEVVQTSDAGVLVERYPLAIAQGIQQLLDLKLDRAVTRKYAEQFDWQDTSDGQYRIFQRCIENNGVDREQP